MSNKNVPVAQYEGGTLLAKYPSITDASALTGTQRAHIGKVASGIRKTAGGFAWKSMKNFTGRLSPRNAGITQMDRSGNVLAVYANVGAASRVTGIAEGRIEKVLVGNGRVAGGSLWAFAD